MYYIVSDNYHGLPFTDRVFVLTTPGSFATSLAIFTANVPVPYF